MKSQHIAVAILTTNNSRLVVISAYFNKNPAIYRPSEKQLTKSERERRLLNNDITNLDKVLEKNKNYQQVIGMDCDGLLDCVQLFSDLTEL